MNFDAHLQSVAAQHESLCKLRHSINLVFRKAVDAYAGFRHGKYLYFTRRLSIQSMKSKSISIAVWIFNVRKGHFLYSVDPRIHKIAPVA